MPLTYVCVHGEGHQDLSYTSYLIPILAVIDQVELISTTMHSAAQWLTPVGQSAAHQQQEVIWLSLVFCDQRGR